MNLQRVNYTVTYWSADRTGQHSGSATLDLDQNTTEQLKAASVQLMKPWPHILGAIVTSAYTHDTQGRVVELKI